MSELVSVIIPIYNAENYLEQCLESVVNQTLKNLEVLLLEDGAEDNSLEICESYAKRYSFIKVIKLSHGGVSKARNKGLDMACGEFVFFMDADDYIDHTLLEKLVNQSTSQGINFGISLIRKVGCKVSTNFPIGKDKLQSTISGEEILDYFHWNKIEDISAIGGKFVAKKLIGEIRFSEDLSSAEDTVFLYEILKQKPDVVVVLDAFYYYRIHSKNTVGQISSRRIQDVSKAYQYMMLSERTEGRLEGEYRWFVSLVIFLSGWARKYSLKDCKNGVRRELLKQIHWAQKNSYYKKGFKRAKLNFFIYKFCPWLFLKRKEKLQCVGCGACVEVCPVGAISLKNDKMGFGYVKIEKQKCTNCGKCKRVCPAKTANNLGNEPTYYSLQANNEIRKTSTSGGAFHLLATWILHEGGVVIGAAMVNQRVKHICIREKADLRLLSGSKYVQSDTTGIFKETREMLENGKNVLFSGTPCQVEALRSFLDKDYDNLWLVDLICNGVASPDLWRKYVRQLERQFGAKLLEFRFRDKRNADDGHTVVAVFENGEQEWSMYEDKFCQTYFSNISRRRECGQCLFCTDRRNADITLGDFWGVENALPKWNDGMGTSLVLAHSVKGKEMIEKLKRQGKEAGLDKIVEISAVDAFQPRLLYPQGNRTLLPMIQMMYSVLPCRIWMKLFLKGR